MLGGETETCIVPSAALWRAVQLQHLLLTPDETIIGSCEDYNIPALGLFEESLVSVGRSIEELIFSSPTTKAWPDIL
jgi:hypothetical protein